MKDSASKTVRFHAILNKGADASGVITYAVLKGEIKFRPAGFDTYKSLEAAKEKFENEEIQSQISRLGIEMEIVAIS